MSVIFKRLPSISRGSCRLSARTLSLPSNRPWLCSRRQLQTNVPPHEKNSDFSSLTWRSIGAFVASGVGLLAYFEYEKRQLEAKKEASKNQAAGKPLVGGPFSLVNHDGQPVTDLDFRGKYMLVYFGYTFCPDVCPEELEKMAKVVDSLREKAGLTEKDIVPIFISCDPKRDSIDAIKQYVREFHPTFVGLIGTHAQIKRCAKAYRLYYSAPPRALDDDDVDYLVDHSIFFYLMDRNGRYIAHFGPTDTAEHVTAKILEEITPVQK
ncbi:Cu-binding protein [Gaertneriomyces sp. JEL0708]|nr:Cu-binding protein [Gaertneriomyces sp. JEL0708]